MNLQSDDESISKVLSFPNGMSSGQNTTEQNVTIIMNSRKQAFMPKWILEKTFPDQTTAFNQIIEEKIWLVDLLRSYTCPEGRSVLYRCNRATKSGMRCHVLKSLFFLNNTKEAYLFKTTTNHNHPAIQSNRRPKPNQKWHLEKMFSKLSDARHYIHKFNRWSYKFTQHLNSGKSLYYRCNLVPKKGPQCDAQKLIVFNKYTKKAKLYETKCSHTHMDINANFDRETKTKWLLKHLNKQTRNIVVSQGFRVLAAVSLKDCLAESDDKLNMLQQETVSDDNLQIENGPLTDNENFTDKPIKANSYEGNDDDKEKNVDAYRQFVKTIFDSEWTLEKEFPNESTALEYLKKNELWIVESKRVYDIRGGQARNIYYRCNKETLSGTQRAEQKCLLYTTFSDEVSLYQKNVEHTYDSISTKIQHLQQQRCLIKQFNGQTIQRKPEGPVKNVCNNLLNTKNSADQVKLNNACVADTRVQGCNNTKSNDLIFGNDWSFEKKFPNESMALDYIEKDNLWEIDPTRVYIIRGGKGRKVHYRCNKVTTNGPQCAAWKCFLYTTGSNEISIYKKNYAHTHDSIADEFKNIETSIRPHQLTSGSSDHLASHATSMEFVTGDDSVQYVINYIDNNEIANDSETANISATSKHRLCCKKMFFSIDKAQTYLRVNNWTRILNTNSGGKDKKYYRCNIVNKSGILCNARAYLLYCKVTKNIIFYRNLVPHTHDLQINDGLALPTQSQNNSQKSVLDTAKLSINSNNPIDMIIFRDDDNLMNITKQDKHTDWKLLEAIPKKGMVASYVKEQNIWQCRYANGGTARKYYYCKVKNCDAEMCIVTKRFSKSPLVYRSGKHTHSTCSTNDLPVHFKATELLPDTFPNSNMIVKEELMINDEVDASYQEINRVLDQSQILPDIYPDSNIIVKEELIINDQNESDSQLLPDTHSHSNMILKEQAINNDKLLASCQNKNITIRFDSKDNKEMSAQKWNFEKEFTNMDDVNRFLDESNGLWKINSTAPHKLYYQCTYTCEPECTAQILFMIDKNSGKVLYFTGNPHFHPVKNDKKPKPPPQTHIPKLNEFKFIEKFANFTDALRKIRQENHYWVSISAKFENGYRQHFSCSYSDVKGACKCRAFFLFKNNPDEIWYYATGEHSHTVNTSEGTAENTTGNINSTKSNECTTGTVTSDESDKIRIH